MFANVLEVSVHKHRALDVRSLDASHSHFRPLNSSIHTHTHVRRTSDTLKGLVDGTRGVIDAPRGYNAAYVTSIFARERF